MLRDRSEEERKTHLQSVSLPLLSPVRVHRAHTEPGGEAQQSPAVTEQLVSALRSVRSVPVTAGARTRSQFPLNRASHACSL